MLSKQELQTQIDGERQQLIDDLAAVSFLNLYEECIDKYLCKNKNNLINSNSIHVFIDLTIIYQNYEPIVKGIRNSIKKGLRDILTQYLNEETTKMARSAGWNVSDFYVSKECMDFTLTVGEKI